MCTPTSVLYTSREKSGRRDRLGAIEWWNMYGSPAKNLHKLAVKVLSQVVNTSSAENQALYVPRCWWHWLLNSFVTTPVKMYLSLKYKLFYWTLLFVVVSGDLVVYVHTNLCLIYKQREEWLKGKTKMWDVFSDDMGLNNSVELALATWILMN